MCSPSLVPEAATVTTSSHFGFFSVNLILPNGSNCFLSYDQTVLMGLVGLVLGYNSRYNEVLCV